MIASGDAKNERKIWKVGAELSSQAEFPSQLSTAQLVLSLRGLLQVGTGDDAMIKKSLNGEKHAQIYQAVLPAWTVDDVPQRYE